MRNLLALLGLALVLFVAFGWYLDWYKIQSTTAPDGHRHIDIDIHSKKIGDDLQRGSEKIKDAWESRSKGEGEPGFVGPPRPAGM
jgi:hypothetical protein